MTKISFTGEDLELLLSILKGEGFRIPGKVQERLTDLTFTRDSDGSLGCVVSTCHDFNRHTFQSRMILPYERKRIAEELEEAARQEDCPVYLGNMEVDSYIRLSAALDIIERR